MSAPDLVEFKGVWDEYVDEIYNIYIDTVCTGELRINGRAVRVRKNPMTYQRQYGFWHCVQTANRPEDKEEDRVPDLRRCERIRWISWMISNCNSSPSIVSWTEDGRNGEKDLVLWYDEGTYVVVLAERTEYYLLRTAYYVEHRHKLKKLRTRAAQEQAKKLRPPS